MKTQKLTYQRPENGEQVRAIHADGTVQRFGSQIFARMSEVSSPSSNRLRRFRDALPDRVAELGKRRIFALCCGELNIVQGRENPRFLCHKSADAITAADIIINPTHDRMSHAGTLDAKRRLLSKPGPDGRERLYVSCSNWEACGLNGRVQRPSPTLHTVYRSGQPIEGCEVVADGKFGFVYQRWNLRRQPE